MIERTKSQVIIFEGPDSSGKSSIARALHEETGFPLMSSEGARTFDGSPTQTNFVNELVFGETSRYETLAKLDEWEAFGLIRDRSFITEYIYSEVFGRVSCPPICRALDEKYAETFNTLVVVCVKDAYDLELLARTQHPSIVEKHSQLDHAYRLWAADDSWKMKRLLLNTTSQNISLQLQTIFKALE